MHFVDNVLKMKAQEKGKLFQSKLQCQEQLQQEDYTPYTNTEPHPIYRMQQYATNKASDL